MSLPSIDPSADIHRAPVAEGDDKLHSAMKAVFFGVAAQFVEPLMRQCDHSTVVMLRRSYFFSFALQCSPP